MLAEQRDVPDNSHFGYSGAPPSHGTHPYGYVLDEAAEATWQVVGKGPVDHPMARSVSTKASPTAFLGNPFTFEFATMRFGKDHSQTAAAPSASSCTASL